MISLTLANWFEIAAALTATIFWRSLSKTGLRWFIPYLWMIVIVELSAKIMWYTYKQPNAWLYNLSVPVEYIFYGFIFRMAYKNQLFKKIAIVFIILISAYSVYSIIFITALKFFNMTLLAIGSFSMVVLSILYFIELYNDDNAESVFRNPFFWIVSGIFLFNTGEFCYNLLTAFIPQKNNGFDSTLKLFRSINSMLILVLYSCFIIGFICQKISGTYKRV